MSVFQGLEEAYTGISLTAYVLLSEADSNNLSDMQEIFF